MKSRIEQQILQKSDDIAAMRPVENGVKLRLGRQGYQNGSLSLLRASQKQQFSQVCIHTVKNNNYDIRFGVFFAITLLACKDPI